MKFCMDYVEKKNVTIMDLISIEQRLRENLEIEFRFSRYYDASLEITIKKGDNTDKIVIDRMFQNEKQAYSEIKNCIKRAHHNMICFYNNCLTLITIEDLVNIFRLEDLI